MKLSWWVTLAVCTPALGQAPAQLWGRQDGTSGVDTVHGLAPDSAGGTITTGYTYGALGGPNAGSADIYVARYDANGGQLWIRQYGSTAFEQARGLATSANGHSLVVGSTSGTLGAASLGGGDGFAVLHDLNGNQVWLRQFGTASNDYALGAAIRGALGAIGGSTDGSFGGPQAGAGDAFVCLLNANTNQLVWTRQLGTAASETASGVAFDSAGGVYLAGFTDGSLGGPNAGFSDAFLAHYDASGNLLWVRQIGTPSAETAGVLCPDGVGGVLIAGTTGGDLAGTQEGLGDIFLARYDTAGNQLWIRQFGTPSHDYTSSLTLTPTGTVLSGGATYGDLWATNLGSYDALLAEFDPIANVFLWGSQFGTPSSDSTFGVAVSSGVTFAAGVTGGALYGPAAGSDDTWLARYGGCFANCDGSTIAPTLNVNDFICFQTQFAAGLPSANCDGSTVSPTLNVNDFVCFLVRYAVGCP